jgi:exodeoxyribonuclease VII large subunit
MTRAAGAALERQRMRLARAEGALGHLNPHRVLERGYAVVRGPDGRAVLDATSLSVGDRLELTLARGGASVTVEKPH